MVTDVTAKILCSSSSQYCAGRRLTLHIRTQVVGVMVIRVLSMDVGKMCDKQDTGNIVVVMMTLIDLRLGHYKYYAL